MLRPKTGNLAVSFNETLFNFGLKEHTVLMYSTAYNL